MTAASFDRARPSDAQVRTMLEVAGTQAALFMGRRRGLACAYDDLFQEGCIGALLAHRTFDPGRGSSYRTWLAIGALGAIRHYMRDFGAVVRRPRWFYEIDSRVRHAESALAVRLGRHPTRAELADAVGLTEGTIEEIARVREGFRLVSMSEEGRETLRDDGLRRLEDTLAVQESAYDRVVTSLAMAQTLGLRDGLVLAMRFYRGCTQTEIAEALGISQKHASRIIAKSLMKLADSWGREAHSGRKGSLSASRKIEDTLGAESEHTAPRRTDKGETPLSAPVVAARPSAPGLPPERELGYRSGSGARPQPARREAVT